MTASLLPTVEELEQVALPNGKVPTLGFEPSRPKEVFIPRGARVLYGLVGGVFTPDNNADNLLKIEVGYILQLASRCSLPLASGTSEAYVSLEKEYAEAISSGLQKASHNHPVFPPGVIKVNCGVISIFGSSCLLYERLGKNLYQVLVSQYQGTTIGDDLFKLTQLSESEFAEF